ncbi:hypothetical protein CDL12_10216 [Handroanthus impetiginosus]|uniref:Uncharacterized protein n=1 Tax=Handroanthus impetiginosus TaxID=429701 RepID=A0A2G9HI12_9LAMI|nr:hypothetical protein CDL12_10216 [Handroanthus impetiginosus]
MNDATNEDDNNKQYNNNNIVQFHFVWPRLRPPITVRQSPTTNLWPEIVEFDGYYLKLKSVLLATPRLGLQSPISLRLRPAAADHPKKFV